MAEKYMKSKSYNGCIQHKLASFADMFTIIVMMACNLTAADKQHSDYSAFGVFLKRVSFADDHF